MSELYILTDGTRHQRYEKNTALWMKIHNVAYPLAWIAREITTKNTKKTNRQNAQLMRHEVGLLMILSIFMPFIILYRTAFGILWYRILRLKIEFINTHSKMADRGTWQTQSIHHTRGLIWNNFEKKIERANSNMNCLQSVTQKMPVARKRDKSTTRAALSYKKHRIE